ncbi:MAG: glycosyltransferase [Patescibacteria group bacterium]|nr:glycosyltransferase [Patescibacteria group bacterium]
MKIILATESYWPNLDGGAVFERNLVHGLGELGHEVRVVAPSPDGKPGVQHDGRSEVHRTRSIGLPERFGTHGVRNSVFPGRIVRELIDGFRPDLIHGHNHFFICLAAQKAARKRGIPYVATYHNMPENAVDNLGPLKYLIPNLVGRIWKWDMKFLNQSSYVTSPTKTAIEYLEAHGLSAPHRPISNGISIEKHTPGPKPKALMKKYGLPDKPIVLYLGRLDGEKQMDVWLDAAAKVRQEIDAHFLIGGRGAKLQALKRQAAALGIAPHVTFAGVVPDEDMGQFYRLGDVFAISSPAELQSLVTLEAMASGLPVVAVDAMALPELCKSGRNGYLFLTGSADGMAESVTRILQNPAMARQMGAESRKIIEQNHDVREMPKHYETVYKEAVDAKRTTHNAQRT